MIDITLIYKKDYHGFVYIWYDTKRKMFYIGSHFGAIDDGYICSSKNMRNNYRYRPETFKRRIIYLLKDNDHEMLILEEKRWLRMIPDEELNGKYYNKSKETGMMTSEMSKAHWANENNRKDHIEGMKKGWTEERRKAHSEKIKLKWESGNYKNRETEWTEERREIQREVGRKYKGRKVKNTDKMKSSAKIRANTIEHKEAFNKLMEDYTKTGKRKINMKIRSNKPEVKEEFKAKMQWYWNRNKVSP